MSTVIRRSRNIGDPRLVRIPFPETGPTPQIRLDVLNFQGVNGDLVNQVAPANGGLSFLNGDGAPPKYRIPSDSGVPGYQYKPSNPTGSPVSKPTLYVNYNTVDRAQIKSMLCVFRVFEYPNTPLGASNPRDQYGILVSTRGTEGSAIFINSTGDTANAGKVTGLGGPGSVRINGPVIPNDGTIHTAIYVHNDNGTAALYVDGRNVGTSPTSTPLELNGLFTGYSQSGGDFDIMVASTYEVSLTAKQAMDKHNHYAALYQFAV